jgi:hypothetical protein
MHPVTVATFNDRAEAEPVRQRLEQAGVRSQIHNEKYLQEFFFLSRPLAGIRLRVDKSDFVRAEALLQQWDKESGLLKEAVRCPECGSSRIDYPQFSRRFTWGGIAAIFASLGFFPKEFFCRDCQYTWPTKIKLDAKRDILGWPEKREHRRP